MMRVVEDAWFSFGCRLRYPYEYIHMCLCIGGIDLAVLFQCENSASCGSRLSLVDDLQLE